MSSRCGQRSRLHGGHFAMKTASLRPGLLFVKSAAFLLFYSGHLPRASNETPVLFILGANPYRLSSACVRKRFSNGQVHPASLGCHQSLIQSEVSTTLFYTANTLEQFERFLHRRLGVYLMFRPSDACCPLIRYHVMLSQVKASVLQ